MINIERRTLFDIIDGYDRASTTPVNGSERPHQAYDTYLNAAAWAASQTVINGMYTTITNIEPDNEYTNRATTSIDTEPYTLNAEMLYHHFNIPPEPNTFAIIIDDCAPQAEITEQELLDFLNGKDDADANR